MAFGAITSYSIDGNGSLIICDNHNSTITVNIQNPQEIQQFLQDFEKRLGELPNQVLAMLQNGISILPKNLTHIPDNLTDYFIGRGVDIDKVHDLLMSDGRAVLVNGMGGIGKSALAQAYITSKRDVYDHLVYVKVLSEFDDKNQYQANNEDALFEAFANHPNLSENLGLEFDERTPVKKQFAQILGKLGEISGTNLLIIDNASDAIAKYREFLPNKQHWKILLTSRQQIVHLQPYFLGILNVDDAKSLFYHYYQVEQDDTNLERILSFVGYHTLTIELLAKQAQKRLISIIELIEMIEKHGLHIPKEAKIARKDSPELKTTIDHLLEIFIIDISEDAQTYLRYFSILPSVIMSFGDLKNYFKVTPTEDNSFFDNLDELVIKGWIKQNTEGYLCHQIIKEVVKKKLNPTFTNCINVVSFFLGQVNQKRKEHGVFKRDLMPFIESIIRNTKEWNMLAASLLSELASFCKDMGEYNKSINCYSLTIDVFDHYLNGDVKSKNQFLIPCHSNLADVYRITGDTTKYGFHLNKSKTLIDLNNNIDSETKAQIHHKLAIDLFDKKKFTKSLEILKETVKILKENPILNLKLLATVYGSMAEVYRGKKDYKNCKIYNDRALQIRKEHLPLNHPVFSDSYNNMANYFFDLKNYIECEKHIRLAIQIDEENFGKKSDRIGLSYYNLSELNITLRKYEEAKEYNDICLSIYRKHFLDTHPNIQSALNQKKKLEKLNNDMQV